MNTINNILNWMNTPNTYNDMVVYTALSVVVMLVCIYSFNNEGK